MKSAAMAVLMVLAGAGAAERAGTQSDDGVIVIAPEVGFIPGAMAEFPLTRWGSYDVYVEMDSVAGDSGGAVLRVGEERFAVTGTTTADSPRRIGPVRVKFTTAGTLRVASAKVTGVEVRNQPRVRRVELHPAPEGEPIVQAPDLSITLQARDATVHGTMLRYESAPLKNTLGYWANERDWVSWDFAVNEPGEFIVFALQGSPAPGGGSEMALSAAGQTLNWTVKDTGSYHTFTFVEVGRLKLDKPGEHTLTLKSVKKVGGAVMDLRQVILLPVLP